MGFDEMQMDFAETAFGMEIGQISKPVKTNYGYSIIRVDDRLGNVITSYSIHYTKLYDHRGPVRR